MKRKFVSLLMTFFIFVFLANISVFASESDLTNNSTIVNVTNQNDNIESTEYFDNGVYCITTTDYADTGISAYSTTKSGSKTKTYYDQSNKAVCAIKLTGTFVYESGESVKCTDITYTTYKYDSDWSIESVNTYITNDTLSSTAHATYKVVHRTLGITTNIFSASNYVKCTIYGVFS